VITGFRRELDNGGYQTLMMYAIPALLYAMYNNLAFVGLQYFDAPTYFILMQIRIAVTGLISQIVFHRQLSGRQWGAIALLTVGCAVKEAGSFSGSSLAVPLAGYAVLMFQVGCSVSAGIANEKLLKGSKGQVNVQNVYMVIMSLLWNAVFLVLQMVFRSSSSPLAASSQTGGFGVGAVITILTNPTAVCIMINNAMIGLAVGYFLKHLDMLLKAIAGAVEIILTVIIAFLLFGTPITVYSFLACVLVGSGVYMFNTKAPAKTDDGPGHAVELGGASKCDDSKLYITKEDISSLDDDRDN
jgi:drug/metabolite transporter (DMT)-like permease